MHGRLKVKTTAEQQEEKRKERQKKLKVFRGVLSVAFRKIKENEFDNEGLDITKQILAANSDYTTMWNFRKTTFKAFKENMSNTEFDKVMQEELKFIEFCLRNNPKSYGCWNQRCFVMLNMNEPDWKKELHLCDLFLQFDDRNFHCWDYRRFVTKSSGYSMDKEISFTRTLIENNFSNYSSWHYRSKLLPNVHPDTSDKTRIAEEKLLEELEFVQNAFFTDPSDQSAWFYHRWLLGRGEAKQSILSLRVTKSPFTMICTLRKSIKLEGWVNSQVTLDDKLYEGNWTAVPQQRYSCTWKFTPSQHLTFTSGVVVCRLDDVESRCSVSPMCDEGVFVAEVTLETFRDCASDAKLIVLEEELKSCQELNELEPDNKWVVLTLVLLMKSINTGKYFSEMMRLLKLLSDIDPKRSNYYSDLQSRYQLENLVMGSNPKVEADFSGRHLTRLCHHQFLAHLVHLDVSNNNLNCLNQTFSSLICLKTLKASVNRIKRIDGIFTLPSLREVDLRSNDISSQDALNGLTSCESLSFVYLEGNPLKAVTLTELSKHFTFNVDLPFTD